MILNRKVQINILIVSVIIIVVAVSAGIFLADKFNITGLVIGEGKKVVEKTSQIEVWADSYVELEIKKDSILTKTYLDNGTLIEETETEFYINNQKSNSLNKSLFNLSETSPGRYTLKVLSQGSPAQFVNPSTIEKQIEITDVNGIKRIEILEETNETLVEEIQETQNETLIDFELPENLNCVEFTETILWSSGYSNNSISVNYITWEPNKSCTDCFIGNLELETRFLSFKEINRQSEGFVQISTQNLEACDVPEQSIYDRYIAYETLHGESQKFGKYCGNNKNANAKCGIEFENNYLGNSCYGIKVQSSPRSIVDAFKIKYTLCSESGGIK